MVYISADALILVVAGICDLIVGVRSVVLAFARRLRETAEQPALRAHLNSAYGIQR